VLAGEQETDPYERLAKFLDLSGFWDLLRIIDRENLALASQDLISHVRRGLNKLQVAGSFEPLLNDLAMQHAEKATAKPETEPFAGLGLIGEAGVVEPKLPERLS